MATCDESGAVIGSRRTVVITTHGAGAPIHSYHVGDANDPEFTASVAARITVAFKLLRAEWLCK